MTTSYDKCVRIVTDNYFSLLVETQYIIIKNNKNHRVINYVLLWIALIEKFTQTSSKMSKKIYYGNNFFFILYCIIFYNIIAFNTMVILIYIIIKKKKLTMYA